MSDFIIKIMNSDSKQGNSEKKQIKNPIIKLQTNDQAWGAPTAKPVVLLQEKVERYMKQHTNNELQLKILEDWLKK